MSPIHRTLRRAAGVSITASLLILCSAFTAGASDTGTVLGEGVRLRSAPSTDSEVLEVLDQGDTLEILDSNDQDWFQVSYAGDDGQQYTGYVSRALVSAGVTQTATITGGAVELKSEPDSAADVLAQIPDGSTVVLLDTSAEDWIQVSYAGDGERLSGYIASSALYVNPLATGMTAGEYTIAVLGDCDGSGTLSQADLRQAQALLLEDSSTQGAARRAGDLDGDGLLTTQDLVLLSQRLEP